MVQNVDYARGDVKDFEPFYGYVKNLADQSLAVRLRELRQEDSDSKDDVRVDLGFEVDDWRDSREEWVEEWAESQIDIEFEEKQLAEGVEEGGIQDEGSEEEEVNEMEPGEESIEEEGVDEKGKEVEDLSTS